MRVAVSLPSLEPGSLHRREIDAAIHALAAQGVEVECFAEATRLCEDEAGPPCWHYLRMGERHGRAPFDAALYPLGRDYRPYEPSWILMHQFPGTVWVLDPVLHHLAVGGMVLRGRWDAYRSIVAAAFGDAAPVLTDVLASWWTTSSFYGRHDPVPACLAGQRRVLVGGDAIAASWSGSAPSFAATVPLPRVGGSIEPVPHEGLRQLAVLSSSLTRPEPVLRGLRDVIERHPELHVVVVAPELVHEHRLLPASRRIGGLDSIDWFVGVDWVGMRELVESSDVTALLRADLSTAEEALLHHTLRTGAAALVLDTPAFERYPPHAVAKGSPGQELQAWLPAVIDALCGDAELAAALRASGQGFWQSQPDADAVATVLAEELTIAAAGGPLQRIDLAAPARAELAANLRRLLATGGDSSGSAAATRRALTEGLGPTWWPDVDTVSDSG